jgi:hypothetical protein
MAIRSLSKEPIEPLCERSFLPRSQLNHRATLPEIAIRTKSLTIYENRSAASDVWPAMVSMEVVG